MKQALGKGMLALMDENIAEEIENKRTFSIPIDKIMPNRYQPRKNFDEESLKELADSIKANGIIQPVIVSELGDGTYELIAGERRWRAAKIAGLTEIPVIIRDCTEAERLEIALIENIQRENLNPIEEALAYKEILERLSITQDELAQKIGKNRATITNTLRLLKLPEYVREKIVNKEISEGHARVILSLEDIDKMIAFTDYIIQHNLSVRETEKAVKDFLTKNENVSRETSEKTTNYIFKSFEDELIRSVGAKVEIKGNHKKGKIEIHYFSAEEFEKIFNQLKKISYM
ncbi:MAG: ParB/RepB/Spo0J family partition protein [Brevinematales bacterium]|nr:ParB/RepB/Spo0J family partition protein [Brevinematales bacterium]